MGKEKGSPRGRVWKGRPPGVKRWGTDCLKTGTPVSRTSRSEAEFVPP